jgi:hypothetical protein
MNVDTIDISIDEWKYKVKTSDMDWLILQYRGFQQLTAIVDEDIDNKTQLLKIYHPSDFNEMYREVIYPLEDKLMDIDIQLVDVEEEIEDRMK